MRASRVLAVGVAALLHTTMPPTAPVAIAQPSCVAAACAPAAFGAGQIFGGFNDGPYRPGQVFSPRFRGVLREVRLGLVNGTSPTDTTRVVAEIRSVAGDFPTSVVLAEALVAGAPYVAGNLYTASFAGHDLVLDSGTRYAIVLRKPGSNVVSVLAKFPVCGPATGTVHPVHTYDGGATWGFAWSPTDRSMIYEVCADAATPATRTSWGSLKTHYR